MKITKRLISMLLALTLLVGMFPMAAQAEDVQSTVDSGNTTIEGTNGFGNLLAQDLQEEQAAQEDDYSGGYNVIGLTIEDGIATVEYDSMEEAVLVVALYTEDGLQMLVSGNTLVDPENTVATVELEGDIPEYFMASAYLMDTFDYSPLCSAYDTPMYTKEMQDLLASTTDDYDADKILNLDDSKETNFAVFAENTKVIDYVEGINTVISTDDETLTYIIENADENITGLQVGDVLAYTYGEDQVLIVKVATIAIDGTTVTLTGSELEMEEVFSHVKMESTGDTEDLTVDEATGDEGISYVGKITDEAAVMALSDPYAVNPADSGEVSKKYSLGFKLEKESGSIKLKGSLALDVKVEFSYYISWKRQFVEFKTDINTRLTLEVSGKVSFPIMKLGSLGFSPVPGVYIGFEPQLVLEFAAKISASVKVGYTKGFACDFSKGIKDLSTDPKVEVDLDAEGTIFFGVDMMPNVSVLGGALLKFSISAQAGIELKANMGGLNYDGVQIIGGDKGPESIHTCEACLKVELYRKAEFSIKVEFLKFIELSHKIATSRSKLGVCYYSFENGEFGWGSCPNKTYRVAVIVQDVQGHGAYGTEVYAQWEEKATEVSMGKTNSKGIVVDYLPAGTYKITATVNGEKIQKEVSVKEACKVTVNGTANPSRPTIEADQVIDETSGWKYLNGYEWLNGAFGSADTDLVFEGNQPYDWEVTLSPPSRGSGVKFDIMATLESPSGDTWSITKTVRLMEAPNKTVLLSYLDFPILTTNMSGKFRLVCDVCVGVKTFARLTQTFSRVGGTDQVTEKVEYTDGWIYKPGNEWLSGAFNTVDTDLIYRESQAYDWTVTLSPTKKAAVDVVASIADADGNSVSTVTKAVEVGKAPKKTVLLSYLDFPILTTNMSGKFRLICDVYYNGTILARLTQTFSRTSGSGEGGGDNNEEEELILGWQYLNGYEWLNGVFNSADADLVFEGDQPYDWEVTLSPTKSAATITVEAKLENIYGQYLSATRTVGVGKGPAKTVILSYRDFPQLTTSMSGKFRLICDVYYNGRIYASLTQTFSRVGGANEAAEVATVSEDEWAEDYGGISTYGIWGGEYETEELEGYTLKTATFSGLVPGEEYVLLSLVSTEGEDWVAPENLLYIDQNAAGEDGSLVFTYVQRMDTSVSYVMACGATYNNLNDAEISFPEMAASEEIHAVEPTVVFDGKTLVEGVDYTIVGTTAYTAAGTYTCYIRGIYNYSGTVKCTYQVVQCAGDMDGDGSLTCGDPIYLLLNLMFGEENYPLNGAYADRDGNGTVNQEDAVYLLLHTLFGEEFYPLVPVKANPVV